MNRMEKKKLLTLSPILVALFLVVTNGLAQYGRGEDRYKDYQLYFEHPREEIYLDLPKGVFYPNEPIQFAGYVFDKLNSLPAVLTTNVYCAVYDEFGSLIVQKLFYAREGKFEGVLEIPAEQGSGKYYIKAFTNWMKNFSSNAMYLRDIYVVDENFQSTARSNIDTPARIEINPESSELIAGVRNSVGFAFFPGQGGGSQVSKCQLTDIQGQVLIQEIEISPQGYGRFFLSPLPGEEYLLKIETQEGVVIQEKLPQPVEKGVSISVNSLHANHIAIEVRRPETDLRSNSVMPLDLALHRDGKIKLMQFDLKPGESNIFIPKKEAFSGLNKMSIFDAQQSLLADRIIFNDYGIDNYSQADIRAKGNRPDSVEIELSINGVSKKAETRLSLSVLPEESLADDNDRSIRSWFMLQSFFSKGIGSELTTAGMSRLSMHHLDLFLLNNSWNRYSWEDVLQNKPRIDRSFDNGISISGQIKGDKSVQNKRLIMYQKSVGEFFYSRVGPDLSFAYDNVYVIENEPLLFFVEDHELKKSTRVEVSLNPSYSSESLMAEDLKAISSAKGPNVQTDFDRPVLMFPSDEELDEVLIVAKVEPKLTRNQRLASGVFEGNKIDQDDLKRNTYLSEYIRKLGFKVRPGPIAGEVIVSGKFPMSKPPVVYINGFRIDCINGCQINDLLLTSVDEVYYEHVGIEGSDGGTLYIYELFGSRNSKNKILQHIAEVGFSTQELNQRFKYSEFAKNTFLAYGNIHWESDITIPEGESTTVKFPSFGLSHFKIIINGFSDKGDLISTVNYLLLD
ncbi:hypothetical protein [Aureitalea marina]|uniref:TonB-dependent receptor plug domain-containing protein n=1 Tax=Aureitalea marina TaxID=930804 RepID=A0A2S7KP42_9FLAO|nr:hypothetical protein [Aureitalea marina]PQB04399.1 hypothetical protein BST85_05430 [Aureitalea marina]